MNTSIVNEESFDVNVLMGQTNYSFSIYPTYDKNNDARFIVGLDGVDIGEIGVNERFDWEWKDGGLNGTSASEIGSKIEAHYD